MTNKVDHLGTNLFFYSYDAEGRLTNRWSAAKGNTRYAYDVVGNLTNVVYASSGSIVLQYDQLNRLTNMVDAVGATRYAYNQAGLVTLEDGPKRGQLMRLTYSVAF